MKLLKVFLFSLTSIFSCMSLAEVAVIVNASNGNALADSEISRAFLGKLKSYGDGSGITPVNLKVGNDTRTAFEKNVLKKSSSQVKAYWSKLVFSGKGKPPKELGSDADVVNFVAGNPGAIGYVDAGSVNDKVKVIMTF